MKICKSEIQLFVFACFLNYSFASFAQFADPSSGNKQIYVGGIYPNYIGDKHQLSDLQGGLTFNIGLSKNYRILKSNFTVGIEYLNRAFNFNSYFFSSGQVPFYDKNFAYRHEVTSNELQIPLLYHIASSSKHRASNNQFYCDFGLVFHAYVGASTSIVSNSTGVEVYAGNTILQDQYPLIAPPLNVLFRLTTGCFFRNSYSGQGLIVELHYTYDPSQLQYTGSQNSNLLYFQTSLITLNVGYKF